MKRGEIYLLKIEQNQGSIQAGLRPVIVVQNDIGNHYSPTTIVCGITTAKKREMPTHVTVPAMQEQYGNFHKESTILCEQIFTVNKSDLLRHIGTITNKTTLDKLDICIRISLGIL